MLLRYPTSIPLPYCRCSITFVFPSIFSTGAATSFVFPFDSRILPHRLVHQSSAVTNKPLSNSFPTRRFPLVTLILGFGGDVLRPGLDQLRRPGIVRSSSPIHPNHIALDNTAEAGCWVRSQVRVSPTTCLRGIVQGDMVGVYWAARPYDVGPSELGEVSGSSLTNNLPCRFKPGVIWLECIGLLDLMIRAFGVGPTRVVTKKCTFLLRPGLDQLRRPGIVRSSSPIHPNHIALDNTAEAGLRFESHQQPASAVLSKAIWLECIGLLDLTMPGLRSWSNPGHNKMELDWGGRISIHELHDWGNWIQWNRRRIVLEKIIGIRNLGGERLRKGFELFGFSELDMERVI
ncbi:hypothetical protein LXL04_027451 [Taraxacum kok-saghyz]